MSFQNIIDSAINSTILSVSDKTIIALRGIGTQQVAALATNPAALSNGASYVTADGHLDLLALEASKQMLLVKALQASGIMLALYEELLVLAPSLSLIGAKVVVIENNLFFRHHAPSYLVADQAKSLARIHSKDLISGQNIDLQEAAKELYANIEYAGNGTLMVTHLTPMTDENIRVENLFSRTALPQESSQCYREVDPSHESIEAFALNMIDGIAENVTICLSTQVQQATRNAAEVFAGALESLGLSYSVDWIDPYAWEEELAANQDLDAILKQHWGENAEFRMLNFYKNPARSKDLTQISQGVIVGQAVEQAELALEEKPYRNLFITAPTGAGKSLLFQLPAVYLARHHQALTIVISPLMSLMEDQVKHLHRQGIKEATYFNSDLSQQERARNLADVLNGTASIVYVSPEMFLSSGQISEILEARTLGLVVVDEAHTVTTWGKDFRADYWFLGDRLRRLKSFGRRFPIMCLTATAVLGGEDDTVNQTLQELGIDNPLVYFGDVKRDNIAFDVQLRDRNDFPGGLEEAKLKLAATKISEYVSTGHKSLVYCPYVSQTHDVQEETQKPEYGIPHNKVWKYNGRMESEQKSIAEKQFSVQPNASLVCTKAYGMGIDNGDIDRVYHYAPTGGLADYVQEIGRAGRKKGAQAIASIDFFGNDTRYVRSLAGMNELTHKQLRQVMAKLYEIYSAKGKNRNMLVSPQSFSYLFGEEDCGKQFRRAMMILAADFQNMYGYPMLIVRPQASFTKVYVNVPDDSLDSFLEAYDDYAEKMAQPKPRKALGKRGNGCVIRNNGTLYRVDMEQLWQDQFSDLTFPQLKRKFFMNELFEVNGGPVSPRRRLTIKFNAPFNETMNKFEEYIKCIDSALMGFKSKGKAFSKQEFVNVFMGLVGEGFEHKDGIGSAFEFFVSDQKYRGENSYIKDSVECVFQRRVRGHLETQYLITKQTYVSAAGTLVRDGSNCAPNLDDETFEVYLASGKTATGSHELRFASLIQLFGLGTYEVTGGEDPQMFVRVNRPLDLKRYSENKGYRNAVLNDMQNRKKRSADIMMGFFLADLSDEERWDVIEDYFLGDTARVKYALGISEDAS